MIAIDKNAKEQTEWFRNYIHTNQQILQLHIKWMTLDGAENYN